MPMERALPGNVILAHPENRVSGHPAPGPVAIPDCFVRAFSDPGDLVADPFAGSGTTGVAAVRLGRCFIGWPNWPGAESAAPSPRNKQREGTGAMLRLDCAQDLMRYEAGELTQEEVVDLFQKLVDSGLINHLQGSYQRTAAQLMAAGMIAPAVPSR